ncbi:hypothetical protein B0T18DRAFT_15693 [Schizothecium vesticola]|uniref:Uncharacterized protein n=1 Tax=Schizothecium vesticola TaxID=314040 RepID=A0AA40KBT9_9PEZI|nr:hypothetical protein B0T18DRAFT_15693 [Schizothecium vesticola]
MLSWSCAGSYLLAVVGSIVVSPPSVCIGCRRRWLSCQFSGVAQNNNRQMDRARKASNERTTAAPPSGEMDGARHPSLPRQNGRRARYPRGRSDQSGMEAGPTDEGGLLIGVGYRFPSFDSFRAPWSLFSRGHWLDFGKRLASVLGREVGVEKKGVSLKVRHTKRRSSKESESWRTETGRLRSLNSTSDERPISYRSAKTKQWFWSMPQVYLKPR